MPKVVKSTVRYRCQARAEQARRHFEFRYAAVLPTLGLRGILYQITSTEDGSLTISFWQGPWVHFRAALSPGGGLHGPSAALLLDEGQLPTFVSGQLRHQRRWLGRQLLQLAVALLLLLGGLSSYLVLTTRPGIVASGLLTGAAGLWALVLVFTNLKRAWHAVPTTHC